MTIDLNRLSDSTQTYKFIPLFTVSYFQSENLEIPGYYKGRQFRQFLCFSFQEYYRQHQQNVSCLTWSHSLLCSKCFLCSVCLRRESHQFFCTFCFGASQPTLRVEFWVFFHYWGYSLSLAYPMLVFFNLQF